MVETSFHILNVFLLWLLIPDLQSLFYFKFCREYVFSGSDEPRNSLVIISDSLMLYSFSCEPLTGQFVKSCYITGPQ